MKQTPIVSIKDQIKAILSEHYAGVDGWNERVLGIKCSASKAYKFEDLFSVTRDQVYAHVKVHGWDARVVKSVQQLPAWDSKDLFWGYMLLPPKKGCYPLAYVATEERQQWYEFDFASEEARDRYIIEKLFETRRNFWDT